MKQQLIYMGILLLLTSEALKGNRMFNPVRQNDAWGDGFLVLLEAIDLTLELIM